MKCFVFLVCLTIFVTVSVLSIKKENIFYINDFQAVCGRSSESRDSSESRFSQESFDLSDEIYYPQYYPQHYPYYLPIPLQQPTGAQPTGPQPAAPQPAAPLPAAPQAPIAPGK